MKAKNRNLTHIRRRRRGWRLVKNVFLFYFEISHYLDLFSVFVGIKTCPSWICFECVQVQIEIRKISHCGSRSPNNAEFGHFPSLFYRGRQRNVSRIITHVHSYCFAHLTFCSWRSRCRCRRVFLRKVPNMAIVTRYFCLHLGKISTRLLVYQDKWFVTVSN